jgi:hypothetical protein
MAKRFTVIEHGNINAGPGFWGEKIKKERKGHLR